MFKIYELPQDPDCDIPPINKQDLKMCRKELTTAIDDIEFDRKKMGISDEMQERLMLLYSEMEDVVLLLKGK